MQSDMLIRIVRNGKEISELSTIKQVVAALETLQKRESIVSQFLGKFPGLRSFNLKAIAHRISEGSTLPKLKSEKKEALTEIQTWTREFFKNHDDYLLHDSTVHVIANMKAADVEKIREAIAAEEKERAEKQAQKEASK